jgi:catechol 2,3-dioxygenase-like lactoylglutathione lyase family enzyme
MFTSLDHIIIGVRDLDAAAQTFDHKLGLVPSGGGIHPAGGTANRIIVIGDTYLELITIHKPEEAQESLRRRLKQAEGYLNFVLASDAIEADCQAMRQRGVTLIGPTPGTLRAGDGRARGWRRADVERPDMVQRCPFLIQHDSAGEERRHRLAGWSTPPEHPLGVVKVQSVTLAVANLAEASSRFAHIYGLQPSEPFSGVSQGWGAQLVVFGLGTSGQTVEMAAPAHEGATVLAGDGLQRHLEQLGESLFRITLLVKDLEQARSYLDAHTVAYTMSGTAQDRVLWIDSEQSNGAALVLRQV